MRIHHLNCGTLRPLGGRRINGTRPPFLPARMVCHCLLVETAERLILVDTGLGFSDIDRLKQPWRLVSSRRPVHPSDGLKSQLERSAYTRLGTRARLERAETAVAQVLALGYAAQDVSDIVLTHLDFDHAGGLPDFPKARIHVDAGELRFAADAWRSAKGMQRFRYWPYQWEHQPRWLPYEFKGIGDWFGLPAMQLRDLPEMCLVSLPGHSIRHSGVVIRSADTSGAGGSRWLLHAADSYFDHQEVDAARPATTPGLASFQARLQYDGDARKATRQKLRELRKEHGEVVTTICTHDPVEFDVCSKLGHRALSSPSTPDGRRAGQERVSLSRPATDGRER